MENIKKHIISYIEQKVCDVIVEDISIYGTKKCSVTLGTTDYMMSIEILDDFTYDTFIVRIEDDEMSYMETVYCENLVQLVNDIEKLIDRLNTVQLESVEQLQKSKENK